MLRLANGMMRVVKLLGENLLFLTAMFGLGLFTGGVAMKADPATAAILAGMVLFAGPVILALKVSRHA